MNLWQMLMARRGLMDVAESHERGGAGAGAPAGAEEQGTQESGKQNGEQKDQPKIEDDEFGGMTQEELLAELRKSKKAGADLLKENMKRKEKERAVLVDGEGKPLPFESAIERILRADPEADALLRSEAKQGSGSISKPTCKVTQPKNK